jgi:DNA polymerase-3 subunit epsilon
METSQPSELNRTWIAFDLETTGLNPRDDRIVEIGAVRFDGAGREVAVFERLVNPRRPSHPRARAVHGIDDAVLAKAPPAEAILPGFLEFLGDPDLTTVLAHNAGFDAAFLGAELSRLGRSMPGHGVIDTLALARRSLPHLPSHRLDGLARHLGLDPCGPHRALADSRRVMLLWLALGGEAGLPDRALAVFPIHDPSGPPPAPRGWEPLAEAASLGWPVRVVYEGGTRGDSPRTITPRRFAHRGGVVYVVSLCHIDGKEKGFRLDRVRTYEVVPPPSWGEARLKAGAPTATVGRVEPANESAADLPSPDR